MKNLDSVLAIIPAKKRSTRLPNKNLKLFNNYPLIYFSIKFELKSKLKNILVSSDCDNILSYSKSLGVDVVKRPDDLSTDLSSTVSVLKHSLETYRNKNKIDTVVTLQPTSPLRSHDLFDKCFKKFINSNFDSLISVGINRKKLGHIDEKNLFLPFNYELGSRSQDLKKSFYENGLIYFSKAENIKNNDMLGKKIGTQIIKDDSSFVDIDDLDDFKLALLLFKKNYSEFKYLIEN